MPTPDELISMRSAIEFEEYNSAIRSRWEVKKRLVECIEQMDHRNPIPADIRSHYYPAHEDYYAHGAAVTELSPSPSIFSEIGVAGHIATKYIEDLKFGGAMVFDTTIGPTPQDSIGWSGWDFHDWLPHIGVREEWREQLKGKINALLQNEDQEEKVAPEAVDYACRLVDQLPYDCGFLPGPDVSGFADKEAVYCEWVLETDGQLMLTVEPDGTVAYVLTFGEKGRSKNFGAWEDEMVDFLRPCFAKLVKLRKKDFEWDESRITHPSPGLSSKAIR